jgi:hypothetical protein
MMEGSQIVFSNVNGTAYNNFKYTNNGSANTTGPGLADTTVSPLGFRTNSLKPLTSNGLKFRYLQLANPNEQLNTFGKIWGNSTFVSDSNTSITVDLYMPGSVEGADSPDATVTMTKTTNASSANATYRLGALFTGDRPRYALVVITVKNPSATAGATAFVADILNGTNNVTNLSLWYRGEPSTIMFELLGDSAANAIAMLSNTETWGANTIGKAIRDSATQTDTVEATLTEVLSNTDATQAKVNNL